MHDSTSAIIFDLVKKNARMQISSDAFQVGMSLVEDLGLDSIELMKLVVEVEATFNITFNPSDLSSNVLNSIESLSIFVNNKIEKE